MQSVRIAARRVAAVASRAAPAALGRATAAGLFAGVTVTGLALATANPVACEDNKLPPEGVAGSKYERTFIAIKPDGVQRGLIGKIIQRFEDKGHKLVAMKLIFPTKERAEEHYADLSKKPFFGGLTDFFSSGPIVAMVWEGDDVILGGRRMLGTTNPRDSAPGSIRGDFCVVTGRNIIHGSDGPESAKHEINMWFKPNEVYDHSLAAAAWVYED